MLARLLKLYCLMMRERMTVPMTAGMIIFSPESSLRVFVPNTTSWTTTDQSGDIFCEMIYFFMLNSCKETRNSGKWLAFLFPGFCCMLASSDSAPFREPKDISWSSALKSRLPRGKGSVALFADDLLSITEEIIACSLANFYRQ